MGSSLNAMPAKGYANYPNAEDTYGFSAIPAGHYGRGDFNDVGSYAKFWSTAENNMFRTDIWIVGTVYVGLVRNDYDKRYGLSIRCVKD